MRRSLAKKYNWASKAIVRSKRCEKTVREDSRKLAVLEEEVHRSESGTCSLVMKARLVGFTTCDLCRHSGSCARAFCWFNALLSQ